MTSFKQPTWLNELGAIWKKCWRCPPYPTALHAKMWPLNSHISLHYLGNCHFYWMEDMQIIIFHVSLFVIVFHVLLLRMGWDQFHDYYKTNVFFFFLPTSTLWWPQLMVNLLWLETFFSFFSEIELNSYEYKWFNTLVNEI